MMRSWQLLQHGACTTGYSMSLLAAMLKGERRVLIPDLLDFDYSFSSTPKRTAQLSEHVAQTVALVKHYTAKLGVAQIDLCGHSHGGHVVAATAQRVPSLVRKLLLLCPAGLRLNQLFKTMQMWQGDPDAMASRVHCIALLYTRVMTLIVHRYSRRCLSYLDV